VAIRDVANLVQGVSQQAAQQRRDSQCEAQYDCMNSPVLGAVARPCSELVRMNPGLDLTNGFFKEVTHDDESYLISIVDGPGGLRVFNLADGTSGTVTIGAADSYLAAGTSPRFRQHRAVTVDDFTFIVNREIIPAMAGTLSPANVPTALAFVRSGAYSATYSITLSGPASVAASFTTPASNDVANEEKATTIYIAQDLAGQIDGVNGYSCDGAGSTLKIWRADGADFDVAASDGNGDEFMKVFKDVVPSFTELPAKGFDGVAFKVQGESKTSDDDYYVEWDGPSIGGVWEERAGFAVPTTLDPAKMPHVLINTGLNAFTYDDRAWSTRIAGDEDTAEDPSFVGSRIRDILYNNNRLGILHDTGVVFSKDQFPFTFFPDTVQTVLATAPVDMKVVPSGSARGASKPDFTVEVDESLFIWAQRSQRRITAASGEAFKQDTVENKPSSAFEYSSDCYPLAVGTSLYFATEYGNWSAIRAIQYSGGKPLGDGVDVTAHVPQYVSASLRGIAASDTIHVLFAWASSTNALYVYNYLLSGTEYVQSAWNIWRIPSGPILWAGVRGNALRVLQQRPDGAALLKFDLMPVPVDPVNGATYQTRLDNRVDETQVNTFSYDATSDTSSFVIPYIPEDDADLMVVTREDKTGGYKRGRIFEVVSVTFSAVTVRGNLTGYKFYVGQRITAERIESRFFVRSDRGPVAFDRLTVGSFHLQVAGTGYTRLECITPGRDVTFMEFDGRALASITALTGAPPLRTGKVRLPVNEVAERATVRMVNDSFLPSAWQSATWEYDGVQPGEDAVP
jgi:hypothetical protein